MRKRRVRKLNKSYELKPVDLSTTVKRVIGFDPGSRNFGISCVGVDADDKVIVLGNSLITNPIFSLAEGLPNALDAFLEEVGKWFTLFKPNAFVMERFQTRGGMGPLIELVSGMNLAVCSEYRHLPFKLTTAAIWKNQWHRRFDTQLDDMYRACLTTPHQLDATLIGCYGLELGMRKQLVYGPKGIIRQTQATSLLKLRRPR